jgi:hypothetical protein
VAAKFYETVALAAFALLGLWWVVVADRRREWARLSYRRRQAFSVSLYFTLTGIMSLVSLNSEGHPAIWRVAFGLAGALGAVELVFSLFYLNAEPRRARRIQLILTTTLPLYLLIVAIAIHPSLAADAGINLKPLETEAIVVSLLLFLGINYAWLLFMEPAYDDAPRASSGHEPPRP